jgi:hypothetical protein
MYLANWKATIHNFEKILQPVGRLVCTLLGNKIPSPFYFYFFLFYFYFLTQMKQDFIARKNGTGGTQPSAAWGIPSPFTLQGQSKNKI